MKWPELLRSKHCVLEVDHCNACPFHMYTGCIYECLAPVKRRPTWQRCETANEAGKVPRDCPLKWRPVLVRWQK